MQDDIDFWFSIGSTYTYLTVMRLPEVERASGVRFRWRPFSGKGYEHPGLLGGSARG
jgi:2-hydroxychromene-2-carboxylate isomerase